MSDFAEYESYDAVGLAKLVADRSVSASELVAAAIERIERHNPGLNAVVTKTYNRGLARVNERTPEGVFGGVPFLIKDLDLHLAGVPSTSGSRARRWFVPPVTSTLAERYEAAGLVILGTTNTPELGLAPVTEPELSGATLNPWDTSRTPGGSSGGSGAAVASGMVPMAHASDGGGSIRIPASNCALFGMKPTRGRTPVGPALSEMWNGLGVSHALTRSVRDSAALLDATAGPEVGAPYAAPPASESYLSAVETDPGRLRIGIVRGGIFSDDVDAECRSAVHSAAELLHDLGHTVEGLELPIDRRRLKEAFLTIVAGNVAATIKAHAEGGKPDPAGYELETWVLALVGRKLTAEDFALALTAARDAGRAMAAVMGQFDVVVTSTLASPPLPIGALKPTAAEHRLMETLRRAPAKPALLAAFRQMADKVLAPIPNTPLFNMTGQPAMSVPLHWSSGGLPVGVQFAGRFGDEATLFRLAGQLEQARPWFHRRPGNGS